MRPRAPWTTYRVVSATITTVSLVVLGLGMAATATAWSAGNAASDDGGNQAATNRTFLEPNASVEDPIGALPLRSSGDPIQRRFPDGLTTTEEVREALEELARPLGLGDEIVELVETDYPTPGSEVPQYPYAYPQVDARIAASLNVSAATAAPDQVLDLTALLILSSAAPPDDVDDYPSDGIGLSGVFTSSAMVAYSVLRQIPATPTTCELQLQLAYTVSLGAAAHDDNLSAEVEVARRACPGDPRPLWMRSQRRAATALDPGSLLSPDGWIGGTLQELILGASEDFAMLRKEFPDEPHGWAGAADLLLDRADAAEARGVRPFETRRWRREAQDNYATARTKSADPTLLVGHARALAANGQLDEALEVLEDIDERLLSLHAVVTQAVRIGQVNQDFAAVADLLERKEIEFPNGLNLAWGSPQARLPSFGRLTHVPSTVTDATWFGAGGADISDVAFIPNSREAWFATGDCLELDAINAVLLTDGVDAAAEWRSTRFTSPVADGSASCVKNAWGPRVVGVDDPTTPTFYESLQDLQRWGGDLSAAAQTVGEWSEQHPQDYGALQRAGEIAYLEGKFTESADRFSDARVLLEEYRAAEAGGEYPASSGVFSNGDLLPPEALIDLQATAALEAAGQAAKATSLLKQLVDGVSALDDNQISAEATEFYARSQLGAIQLRRSDFDNAVKNLDRAVELGGVLDGWESTPNRSATFDHEGDPVPFVVLRGAQENNLALALARDGEFGRAAKAARAALSRDPANPVFLDTTAFVSHLAGDSGAAIKAYKDVLEEDSSSYVSANNLAVLLAEAGDNSGALELLNSAIQASPDYAKAWHNLGVVNSRLGAGAITQVEASLARAGRLSRDERGKDVELIVDEHVYQSGIDISKALPPEWSYVSTATDLGRGFTMTMFLLLLLRASWALGLDRVTERLASLSVSDRVRSASFMRRVGVQIPALLAMIACAGILAVPALTWAATWTERALALALIAALVLLPLGVRGLLSRGEPVAHSGWLPAIAAGVVGAPLGMTFAPFPSLSEGRAHNGRVLWSATASVAVVTAIYAVLTIFSAVPLARFVTMAGIALTGSMLLPFPPFDGAQLKSRWMGVAVATVLGSLTVAITLNWF